MFLINYSQDILFLVLAICVLCLTFFLAWVLYYLVASVRQIHKATLLVKSEVEKISEIIHGIKEAIKLPTSVVALVVEGLKKIAEMGMDVFRENKSKQRAKKTKNGLNKEENGKASGQIF